MTQQQVYLTTTNAFPWLADEEAVGDRQATEALLFTFNADLGFFEARLLGMLRATGARVTVLADARVWDPDTRAIRHAGRSYHLGLCATAAAFHPKFMLVLGPKRALAAVGSGNLTMGGWQYNAETLTVFTGDSTGMPTVFVDIRNMLQSLERTTTLDPIVTASLRRAVEALDTLLAEAPSVDTGHRVHASWDGPLIDALPTISVDELYLSAAFHDPAASAVARILDRLMPRHVDIAVQPGWTHLDPRTLQSVLDRYTAAHGATVRILQDPTSLGQDHARYRHGKLIEWVTDTGERYALTGSPNLSIRALALDPANGGNHEIAVTGPIPDSLFPGGEPIGADEIPILIGPDDEGTASHTEASESPVRLVSARTEAALTEVHLNRVTATELPVEVSLRSDSPDHWTTLGTITPGHQTHVFRVAIPAGSRMRTLWRGDLDVAVPTPPVYVTEAERVLSRSVPTRHASRAHRAVAADLFGDDIALLDSLQNDLAAFAKDISNARQPTQSRDATSRDPDHDHTRGLDRSEPWLWLQDDTIRRYGPGLASWLLALPHLGTSLDSTAEVPWIDKINDDTEVGLEADNTAETTTEVAKADPQEDAEVPLDHSDHSERLKTARRRWAVKAATLAPEVPMLSRIFILRLTLAFWTAGNWEIDDSEPLTLVRDLIAALDVTNDQPDELRDRVGAAAAVAIAVMRQRVDLITQRGRADTFRDAARLAKPLLTSMSENTVEGYTTGLSTARGRSLSVVDVMQVVEDLPGTDALGWLTALMESHGYDITRPADNQVHIHGSFSTPEQIALDAVGRIEDLSPVALWASNDRGDWTLVVWSRPDLVTINYRKGSARWRHQHLSSLMGPAASAAALKRGGVHDLPGVLLPKHKPSARAREVLQSVGLEGDPVPPDASM